MRRRLEAIATASARLVLFLEYVPHNLRNWLAERLGQGEEAVDSACAMVQRSLNAGVRFMNSRGLLHLDAHFGNILTDGQRLYFADFGLATSTRFALSDGETRFLHDNRSHDRCHTRSQLLYWLVAGLTDEADRFEFIRRCAEGEGDLEGLPRSAAQIIRRHAPMAVVINDFYRNLQSVSRTTAYPGSQLDSWPAALPASTGIPANPHR